MFSIGESTDSVSSTSACIVGESNLDATNAGTNAETCKWCSEIENKVHVTLRDPAAAGYDHAYLYTQQDQDQGCIETGLLCSVPVIGMENSSNKQYPAEQRNRIEEEEEVIITEVSKLFFFPVFFLFLKISLFFLL